jgi:hypothetical protein
VHCTQILFHTHEQLFAPRHACACEEVSQYDLDWPVTASEAKPWSVLSARSESVSSRILLAETGHRRLFASVFVWGHPRNSARYRLRRRRRYYLSVRMVTCKLSKSEPIVQRPNAYRKSFKRRKTFGRIGVRASKRTRLSLCVVLVSRTWTAAERLRRQANKVGSNSSSPKALPPLHRLLDRHKSKTIHPNIAIYMGIEVSIISTLVFNTIPIPLIPSSPEPKAQNRHVFSKATKDREN